MTRSFKVKVRLWKYHIPVLPSHTRLHDKLVLQICVWKVSLFRFSQATDFQEPSRFNKDHSSENPPPRRATSSAHWLQLHTGTVASGNTWKQRLQQSVTILLALICGSSWPRHWGIKLQQWGGEGVDPTAPPATSHETLELEGARLHRRSDLRTLCTTEPPSTKHDYMPQYNDPQGLSTPVCS